MAGRGQEILFLIDEVTQLVGQRTGEGRSILAEDLEETVAVHGRNYGVNVVIAHQNLSQVEEPIRNVLMQCGTQIIGRISNPDDTLFLARQLLHYNPGLVKKEEPVWMGVTQFTDSGQMAGYSWPTIIDRKSVEFTPEEQLLLAAEQFRLPRFQFIVRPATAEGTVSDRLYKISIEKLDAGQYPDAEQVNQILGYLRQKSGVAVETLLAEIQQRRAAREAPKKMHMKQTEKIATLVVESVQHHEDTIATPPQPAPSADRLPVAAAATIRQEEIEEQGAEDDNFWQ